MTKKGDLLEMDTPARLTHAIETPLGVVKTLKVRLLGALGSSEDILAHMVNE